MFLRMITASLVRRRSRMLVALLAIAIGATILSGLVTIYYDVPRQMGAQFRSYGANMIFTRTPDSGHFTLDDVRQGADRIGIDDELVDFAPRGGVVLVGADLVGVGLEETEIHHAQPAQGTHPVLKGVLFVAVRHDAHAALIRKVFLHGAHGAILGHQRADAEVGALDVVFLQINQHCFSLKVHFLPLHK